MDADRIKIYVTYHAKTIAFSANPHNWLKVTISNIIRLSKADPQRFWFLPKEKWRLDDLYLGKWDENERITFYPFNDKGEHLRLQDYNIQEKDKLSLFQLGVSLPYDHSNVVKSSLYKAECGYCKDITDWGIHKKKKKIFLKGLSLKKRKYCLVCESCYKNEIAVSKKTFKSISKAFQKAKLFASPELTNKDVMNIKK